MLYAFLLQKSLDIEYNLHNFLLIPKYIIN